MIGALTCGAAMLSWATAQSAALATTLPPCPLSAFRQTQRLARPRARARGPLVIPTALRPHRDFLRFWWARLAGTCASQMLMVAVGWQMYDLTGSAWDLGLVGLL